MVASFMDKAVTKSYVRLPGSGIDKEAVVSFCDLSLGSNLASSIPIPQHVGMPKSITAKLASTTSNSTTHNKRPRTEDNSDDANDSNKRPRIDNTDQNAERTTNDNSIESAMNITSTKPVKAHQVPQNVNTFLNGYNVIKLREENNQLRAENASLKKQVTMFKELIRNPQRLKSVLQRLNECA